MEVAEEQYGFIEEKKETLNTIFIIRMREE